MRSKYLKKSHLGRKITDSLPAASVTNRYAARSKKRGFTVMESIMAFSILTMSIAAFSGIIVASLKNFRNSQEKYVAAKIAQEGIELAINKKDNHFQCVVSDPSCPLTNGWQERLTGSFQVEAARPADLLPTSTFQPFSSSQYICIIESPSKDRGKFGYCNGSVTGTIIPARYTREVTITSIDSYNASVKSVVRWGNGKSLTLESILFAR